MPARRCKSCGTVLPGGARRCPACGAGQGESVSRVWILAFFVMGIVIGLLLLVLDRGVPRLWPPSSAAHPVPKERKSTTVATPSRGTAVTAGKEQSAAKSREKAPEKADASIIEPLHCDHATAEKVWERALSIASISEQDGVMRLAMTRQWEYYSPGHRRSFVETFSESVRCLRGQYRELRFYYQGVPVAQVSAEGLVQMN